MSQCRRGSHTLVVYVQAEGDGFFLLQGARKQAYEGFVIRDSASQTRHGVLLVIVVVC